MPEHEWMSSKRKFPECISFNFPDAKYISVVKKNAELIAKNMGFKEEHVYDIGLIVDEAFVNAVEHGAKKYSSGVTVDFMIYKDKLEIIVEDNGCGFDIDTTKVPDDLTCLHSIRGRGLGLMKLLTDEFEVITAVGAGTRVQMIKYIDSRADSSINNDYLI
ncbi:MAG: ATP-binding protein [Candidatus Riflebacteria bacterium]|nr:ATP-binding protein [Candidatus Riflebacteria bacterium]